MLKAVYPGSFDPPTMGHMDIVERASTIVDELIIGVGANPGKAQSLFSTEERIEMLRECCAHLTNIRVKSFGGLLVAFAHQEGAKALVRGLRAVSDFESEFQMAQMNRHLDAGIETLFLMTNWEHSFLSSSLVREVAALGGTVSGLVPKSVERRLEMKLANKAQRG